MCVCALIIAKRDQVFVVGLSQNTVWKKNTSPKSFNDEAPSEWWTLGCHKHLPTWRHCPSTSASISPRPKNSPPKKAHLDLFIDVFPSKVSHLFHAQTLINWIVNLWWRLIIRPASEVLMRSYFSLVTSPHITSGNSRLRVLACLRVFLPVAREIQSSLLCLLLISSLLK